MADRRPTISDTELDVLKVLWERPCGTVREILTDLRLQGKHDRQTEKRKEKRLLHRAIKRESRILVQSGDGFPRTKSTKDTMKNSGRFERHRP